MMKKILDCGSFPWSIQSIMILDWIWLEQFLGKKCVCDIEREQKSMEANCTLIIVMENG